jgi:hypothetical protein
VKARLLRCTPAPFAGNQLETALDGTDQDGLKHSAFGNGGSKLVDRLLIEMLARLRWIWPDSADFDRPDAARG